MLFHRLLRDFWQPLKKDMTLNYEGWLILRKECLKRLEKINFQITSFPDSCQFTNFHVDTRVPYESNEFGADSAKTKTWRRDELLAMVGYL